MSKASIRERRKLVKLVRGCIKVGDEFKITDDAKINALYRTSTMFTRMKRRLMKLYNELYNKGDYADVVRYRYRKTTHGPKDAPGIVYLRLEEHRALKRLATANSIMREKYELFDDEYRNEYSLLEVDRDGGVIYTASEAQLMRLDRMQRIDYLSAIINRKVVKMNNKLRALLAGKKVDRQVVNLLLI